MNAPCAGKAKLDCALQPVCERGARRSVTRLEQSGAERDYSEDRETERHCETSALIRYEKLFAR